MFLSITTGHKLSIECADASMGYEGSFENMYYVWTKDGEPIDIKYKFTINSVGSLVIKVTLYIYIYKYQFS